MNVPRKYWGEAVRSAVYIMNRTPSRVIKFKTPLQKLHEIIGKPPHNNLEKKESLVALPMFTKILENSNHEPFDVSL